MGGKLLPWSVIGDLVAVPMFALLAYYFSRKKNKTQFEQVLTLFAWGGLVADSLFTALYFLG